MKKKTKQNAAALSAITMALVATTAAVSLNSSAVYAEENEYRSGFGVVESAEQFISTNTLADKHQEIESYISQIVAYQTGANCIDMSFEYNDVYSPDLIWTGNVIDFTYDDEYGYAIFKRDGDDVIFAEVVFESASPYYGKEGKYIYLSYGMYAILHEDGSVEQLNLDTMLPVGPMNNQDKDKNKGYDIVPETYKYDKATYKIKLIKDFYYEYSSSNSFTTHNNNCANAAGVVALNYWNKYHENKILNLTSGEMDDDGNILNSKEIAGKYMDSFYEEMNTNWLNKIYEWGGTLPKNVLEGFKAYIRTRGYNTYYYSSLSTFEEMKYHIDNNRILFITSTNYYFADSIPSGIFPTGMDLEIYYKHYYGLERSHTFVAYGYELYNLRGKEGEDIDLYFLRVANGWGGFSCFNIEKSNITLCTAMRVARC